MRVSPRRPAHKGTKMTFAGLKKDEEIADLIAYLRQFKADGTLLD